MKCTDKELPGNFSRAVVLSAFDHALEDLNGVAGGAFSDLVAAAPEGQGIVVRQIPTDTAYPDQILVAGVQRGGVVAEKTASGGIYLRFVSCLITYFPCLFKRNKQCAAALSWAAQLRKTVRRPP